MLNFSYKNNAKVIFGQNSIENLEGELKDLKVKKMLLLYSGKYIFDLKIHECIEKVCNKLGIKLIENGNIVPNPKVELVRELVDLSKKEGIDFILAVGGGSVTDTAKATAVGAKSSEDVWKFYTYEKEPKEALPIGVISTIASSGSETSNCSIISDDTHKLGIEYDFIIPQFAIIDPSYTKSLPMYQIACGISDTSSHLIERYYTDVEHVDATDYMIEGLLKALMLNAKRLMKNSDDIEARSEIFLISLVAHNNILDSGRMADWASHRIEHEISNFYGLTHGEGMALTMVAYARYMATKKPKKLAQLANRVFNVDYKNYTYEEMANILADNLEAFYRSIGMRTKLSEIGINDDKFMQMGLNATKNDTAKIGHYMPLLSKEIVEVLKLAK
ncbi:iron-containing alcohol dehydrogenase [Sneathia sanguinegens]|uniref:iron-containing alcohol dehydrogenase n=1 Tax=Sneathia sanguinegens TaxID=40543 RepID=UPI002909CF46|nr:iron-containing alcohol dehydrogenase [Sneathia sanguinegens]MDU7497081.1 iron-containing alcohol dehydrogenase [Sneathia sanguinegens]